MDTLLLLFGDFLLAFAGRVLIRSVSLGRWHSEAWSRTDSSSLAPAGALSFVQDGRRVFTHTGQQLAGIVLLALLAALGFLCAKAI